MATRSRSEVVPTPEQPQTPKNERFDLRRTRTRSQSTVTESTNKDASLTREPVTRSRSRGSSRRPTTAPAPTSPPLDLTSPNIDESKIEVINSNLDDITKIPKEDTATSQFRRRTPAVQTTEKATLKRSRGRGSTRANARSLDLDVSGTTNTLNVAEKAPTTARTAPQPDLRNSRKLRYKTRPSETDTNLTGEGLVTTNEVIKSSQNKESVTSQAEIQNAAPTAVETIVQHITEANKPKSTTLKVTKVVRRPLGRGKMNFRPSVSLPKVSVSDEIAEDDNYPESFKALIQAKNASTQASSPTEESLSLKASQKVYKTYPASSQSTLTGPGTNKYSRFRNKQTAAEEQKNDDKEDTKGAETTVAPEVSKPRNSEYKPRGTYSARARKSTSSPSSTTASTISGQSTEKPTYKYNRKFKAPSTETPKAEVNSKPVELSNNLKKTFVRPPVYSRKLKGKTSTEASSTETVKIENPSFTKKMVLPRTSYYSRLRNNVKNELSSTTEAVVEITPESVPTTTSETVDVPLVIALLNNSEDRKTARIDAQPENNDNHMFLISVTSKESTENNTNNDIINTAEESENMPILNVSPTASSRLDSDKYRYHANYKDQNSTNDLDKEKGSSTVIPPVRNLQTRKYGRSRVKSKDGKSDVAVTSPKPRERSIRKFSESFSKTTEASTNGITPEPDKSKSRFSSKYRASYIDKPFYKPTVPTITSSTVNLRLSESLVKPSHVMNVEASHHSPSVTVSIFDALAEILTSTPKPRISSTTEVMKIQKLNTDVKQVLDGVSSNVNVNSVQDLAGQDTFMSTNADVSTTIKSVQPTVQGTPNVINSILVGGTVTQSLNIEDGKPPKDKTTTTSTPTQGSTDSPKMVYNTVSDLLLSNNNLVSSELTSMLSNNIINIIENMDENSRSKLKSLDMAKVLKSGLATVLDNADSIPNTTPYSLEDIRDTANIVIDGIESNNDLQSVSTGGNVNITVDNRNVPISVTQNPATVNIPITPGAVESTRSISSSQGTTAASTSTTTASVVRSTFDVTPTTAAATSPVSSGTDSLNVDIISETSDSTNKIVPLPFLTNFQSDDFTAGESDNLFSAATTPILKSLSLVSSYVSPPPRDIDEIQDPSQVSRLQLWVLSKKARVLKMIEDIIRQHNDELATLPPLTDFVSPSGSINLSERLTNIMNTMIASTETVTTRDIEPTSPMTTPSFVTNPMPTNVFETTTTSNTPTLLTTTTETVSSSNAPSTSETVFVSSRSGRTQAIDGTTGSSSDTTTTETSETINDVTSTMSTPTTDQKVEILSRLQEAAITTTTIASSETMETTTLVADTETTTQQNVETTTFNIDTTTSTDASDSNTSQTTVSTLSVGTSAIPKKDYVIFGILPNNTVVRKNPNEDILEQLTEASPYIVYGVLPNNTVIRKFPNGTRVPRVMQKIDILPISPWSLRNPYSPIHNNPAIVRPQPNPIRESTNTVTSTDTSNNGTERLTNDTVNNQQSMITPSALNIKSSNGITTTIMPEKSTASHVLSLRTTTMLPSIDEILLNSISSAAIQEMVISEMSSSTREPRILTLDIDPETKQIRTEKPGEGDGSAVFKFIPIDEVTVPPQNSNVLKLASTKTPPSTNSVQTEIQTMWTSSVTEMSTQTPQIQTQETTMNEGTTTQRTTIMPEITRYREDVQLLQTLLQATGRDPKNLNVNSLLLGDLTTTLRPLTTTTAPTTTRPPTTTRAPTTTQTTDPVKLLQALFTNPINPTTLSIPNVSGNLRASTGQQATTTTRSIEEDIRQFEEDTKLLQALLQATGQNPASLNIPALDKDTKLLQALLQATGQNPSTLNIPVISGVTSNVRIASNPQTTSLGSNPTTPLNIRPVFATTNGPVFQTFAPRTLTTTLQPVTDVGISTTFTPFNRERLTTTIRSAPTTLTGRRAPFTGFTSTTEMPSSSTFSVEEDLAFLKNLKTVLKTNPNNEDPEAALANRIIALAVERSLNEIQTGTGETVRTGKNIARPTTVNGPSIEDEIRQFQEDTKLLQALLKATGQDPSKLNLPTLPNLNVSPNLPSGVSDDLKLLSNLLASPSPLNEPFDPLTPKPTINSNVKEIKNTALPFGAKIAVKDNLKNDQDDEKLLQTLIKLQGAQETTTQRSKLTITGQSSDEALKKLIQQTQPAGMVSEATRAPISLSTEYGKSNDALLAALLKEQGFGPTTASSLDEQLRLAQWRETAPGSGAPRPNRRPEPAPSARPAPSISSAPTSNRGNWFGSGPFVGNADDRPGNRGAAQTVQSVIRAGQRAATDVYMNGSVTPSYSDNTD
ncbi:hypothetical protein HW555_008347 [Spodoptera exigua]|uniref:Uncharacterized protein n=1 Tax=Spodoptera exigua TaxID=7107 RepID=A0A835GF13_SPOEX|nr:hypothetical protein HW555_008347 [Spodoptera exigua]